MRTPNADEGRPRILVHPDENSHEMNRAANRIAIKPACIDGDAPVIGWDSG